MQKITFPLHPAQQDVYTDQLINIDSPRYNIGGYIKLKGPLNKEKFHQAVNSAPLVFDAFKMRFDLTDLDSLCYFDDDYERLEMAEADFSGEDNPEEAAQSWMQNRFNIPFKIEKQSLVFEHYLIKIADDEHWFFGRYHHLITDGYGFIVWIKYLAQKYRSLFAGDDLEFSYPRYQEEAIRASEYKNSADYELEGRYWKEKIPQKPEKLLQRKYEHEIGSPKKTSTYVYSLNKDERILLDDTQLLTKSGLQQLTIAALLIYLGKSTDQAEFVFGIPVHKRGSKRLRNILGMFSGIMPHKAAFQKDLKLTDLLKEIERSQKKDYRHHNYQIGDLSRSLKYSSEGYLCEITINYELLNFELSFGEEIKATIEQLTSEYQGNPLQLSWRDYGNGQPLQLHIHFWNEYFNHEEVQLLAQRILFILKQFPEGLDRNIGSIDILPCQERQLLESFNNSLVDYPKDKSIVDLIQAQAVRTPGSVAVVFEDQRLTYKELHERSNQLAHYLRSRGVREETLVPICIERSFEMIIGILGILKSGGAYVPIDPEYPKDRISYMLEDTQAKVIVSSRQSRSKLRRERDVILAQPSSNDYHKPSKDDIPTAEDARLTTADSLITHHSSLITHDLDIIELDADWSAITTHAVENLHAGPKPHHLAYVIYTSGSTGKPKGVMIEHRGVVNLIKAQSDFFNITRDERILQFSNYCFDASVEQIFLALFNGAALVLFAEGLQFNIDLFEAFLRDKRISHLHATPFFLETLNGASYESLKRVISGGDICKKELSNHWKNKVNFYNEYGPTETTVTAVEYHYHPKNLLRSTSLPIGKPLANTPLYILNKDGESSPVGVPGELHIGGVQVARGYLNRPDLTAEKFIPDPFSKQPGAKMYKTGDIGRWLPGGNVEYQGRIDDQVKIRGYRIELGEIENALQQSELVNQSVVLAGKDKEGTSRLVGYIVPNGSFNKEAILAYLRAKLPEYMVPALWVELDSLPLTSNGKIDKKALPDPDASGYLSNEYVAPRNEIEAELAGIWKELLGLERVGIHDNFFELGGHSLKAIQLISRLHKRFNIKTDIGKIFSNPTIKELYEVLALEKPSEFVEIKQLPEQDHYELSHAQKRIWVLSHFKDGSVAYSVPTAFVLEGNLQVPAFQRAFDMVIERHETLRTIFVEVDGEPRQKILPSSAAGFKIEEIDLRGNPDVDIIIKKRLETESRQAFDLTKGPLLRAILFHETHEKYILVFNIHHIVSDGWSKGILIKEILYLYKNYSSGVESKLAPLPIQYKEYAAWQAFSSATQGNYWRNLYKKDIQVLNFPLDFERPKVISFSGAMLHVPLSEELTVSLQKMATEQKMTLNNLLLSLYGMFVARYCKQDEIVIGSLTSGRSHVDLENLVGLFINFLPIRLSPKGQLSLTEYLNNSQDSLVQAYSNQDYPFDLMVEDNIQQRDISRNPFFDTMVNFHWENDVKDELSPLLKRGGDIRPHKRSGGGRTGVVSETGISVRPYRLTDEDFFHSVLDFKLDIEPIDGHLDFNLSYNSRLFSRERMSGFLSQFVELLARIVIEPDNYVSVYFDMLPSSNEEGTFSPRKRSGGDRTGVVETSPEIITEAPHEPSESSLLTPNFPINICASFIADPLEEYLQYWSKEFELNINVAFAPYNQVFQQLLNPDSLLNKNKGMNVLFIRIDDWLRDKTERSPLEQVDFLERTYLEFMKAVDHARKITSVPFLIGIVPLLPSHSYHPETAVHIIELNKKLEVSLKEIPGFYFLELNEIASLYFVEEVFDPKSDELGHIPFTQEYYAALGTFISRKIRAYIGNSYKVIAIDCDNTLWKGICGEVGAMGVTIDENFAYFQKFLLKKYNEGFLLALCSKNNEDDVWEVFNQHPGMGIKPEHIAAHRINWNSKHDNLAAIAKELNLGLGSIIFLDDSNFEIEQMSLICPEVLSLALPEDPNSFPGFFDHIWAFDHFQVTEEDGQRNTMYKAEKQRKEEQVKYAFLNDFLESLNIQINLRSLQEKDLQRAVQLFQRTNQFNLNGIRRSNEDILRSIRQEGSLSWIIEVKDRFGDYGIVGLLLARESENTLVLESFMLSCRVLGRNVEDFVLSELQSYCERQELYAIKAMFRATAKNQPFIEFLARTNWVEDPQTNAYSLLIKYAPKELSFTKQ